MAGDKAADRLKKCGFQRLLRFLLQVVVRFFQRFALQIVQRNGGVVTTETDGDRMERAIFGDNRNGTPATCGGLLIDFFD